MEKSTQLIGGAALLPLRDKNVRLIILPGAYHAFDNTSFPTRTPFLEGWLQYDADATTRSVKEIRDFLHRYVKLCVSHDATPAIATASRRSCL